MASRDGEGVNQYDFRRDHLAYVLRPKAPLDMPEAIAWFARVRCEKYDWLGLLCFTLAVKQGRQDRMFCSEFATRFDRWGHFQPFSPLADADHIAPAQFLQSPEFNVIWTDGQGAY